MGIKARPRSAKVRRGCRDVRKCPQKSRNKRKEKVKFLEARQRKRKDWGSGGLKPKEEEKG